MWALFLQAVVLRRGRCLLSRRLVFAHKGLLCFLTFTCSFQAKFTLQKACTLMVEAAN